MWLSDKALRAAFFMRPQVEPLTHKQRVTRQYKRVLKWARDHNGFHLEAYWRDVGLIRDRYEAARHLSNPLEVEALLAEGDRLLLQYPHHWPYKFPTQEDGTKWQRVADIPEELAHPDRLIDYDAEVKKEFDTENANPVHFNTWRTRL